MSPNCFSDWLHCNRTYRWWAERTASIIHAVIASGQYINPFTTPRVYLHATWLFLGCVTRIQAQKWIKHYKITILAHCCISKDACSCNPRVGLASRASEERCNMQLIWNRKSFEKGNNAVVTLERKAQSPHQAKSTTTMRQNYMRAGHVQVFTLRQFPGLENFFSCCRLPLLPLLDCSILTTW